MSSSRPCRAGTSARAHSSRRRNRGLRRRSGGADRQRTVRVLGAVDEAEQVAVVEEPEAVHLVDDGDRTRHRLDHLGGQFEADVEHLGADVEQQIARCGRRVVAGALELDEGVQFGRPGPENNRSQASEPIEVTSDRRLGRIAETDRTDQTRQLAAAPRGRLLRRPRRSSPPGRWPRASAAPARVAAVERARLDPSGWRTAMMVKMSNRWRDALGLCEFIDASPSPFHVCQTVAGRLSAAGLHRAGRDRPLAEPRRRPVLHRAGGLAGGLEQLGERRRGPRPPFRIVGGHTDSPNLRVKQHPGPVGGRLAGRRAASPTAARGSTPGWTATSGSAEGCRSRARDLRQPINWSASTTPLLRVPQLAIHLAEDRKSVTLDPQRHVNAVWGAGGRVRCSWATSPNGPDVDVGRRTGCRPDDPRPDTVDADRRRPRMRQRA